MPRLFFSTQKAGQVEARLGQLLGRWFAYARNLRRVLSAAADQAPTG
jgi:hypothetical protein